MLRLGREVVLFESLFKANQWMWLFGWMFHAALALVLLRHLRYFQQPVWTGSLGAAVRHLRRLRDGGRLAGLWARRLLVARMRYISTPSDHLMLALLLALRSPAWR